MSQGPSRMKNTLQTAEEIAVGKASLTVVGREQVVCIAVKVGVDEICHPCHLMDLFGELTRSTRTNLELLLAGAFLPLLIV